MRFVFGFAQRVNRPGPGSFVASASSARASELAGFRPRLSGAALEKLRLGRSARSTPRALSFSLALAARHRRATRVARDNHRTGERRWRRAEEDQPRGQEAQGRQEEARRAARHRVEHVQQAEARRADAREAEIAGRTAGSPRAALRPDRRDPRHSAVTGARAMIDPSSGRSRLAAAALPPRRPCPLGHHPRQLRPLHRSVQEDVLLRGRVAFRAARPEVSRAKRGGGPCGTRRARAHIERHERDDGAPSATRARKRAGRGLRLGGARPGPHAAHRSAGPRTALQDLGGGQVAVDRAWR